MNRKKSLNLNGFKDKKGQVTVFIIIGIIMLFGTGIFFYLKNVGIGPSEFIQPKTPPVESFIQECLYITAKEALTAVGTQGGYLVLPPMVANNPTRFVSLIPGIGGPYAPKIPYWYYEGKTEVPGIGYIEKEIELYIEENLGRCISNFTALQKEFDIQTFGPYDTTVLLGEKDTQVKLDWNVQVTPRGSDEVTTKDEFLVKLDVPLARMWRVANELLEAENTNMFFEKMTMDLMTAHPPEDIPFTRMTLQCGREQWLVSQVKEKLNYALVPAINAIRFANTNHPPFEGNEDDYGKISEAVAKYKAREELGSSKDAEGNILPGSIPQVRMPRYIPSDTYEYFQYYFNFTEEDYSDFKIFSKYDKAWGMNFIVTPNEYGVMKSGVKDLRSQIMTFLCLNMYHFTYDVVYPVVISIHYPDSYFGEGYTFKFAFPVQIRQNKGDRSLKPAEFLEITEYDLDYCESKGDGPHSIIARDVTTNAEISKVNLTFRCLSMECPLGSTKTNNQHFIWEGNFPNGCYGPLIFANKTGYLEQSKQFDYSTPFYLDMYPTQNVKFKVKRIKENNMQTPRSLDPDMYAMISVEHKNPDLSIFQIYESEGRIDISELINFRITGEDDPFNFSRTEIDLLRQDATYEVNIMLMKSGGANGDDVLIGGWAGNWTVDINEIKDAKEVVFNVMESMIHPTSNENFDQLLHVYELMYNRTSYPITHELLRYDDPKTSTEV